VALSPIVISEALAAADSASLEAPRRAMNLLKTSLDRIGHAFAEHGEPTGLQNLPRFAAKILEFIDPQPEAGAQEDTAGGAETRSGGDAAAAAGGIASALASRAQGRAALAAIAAYYGSSEPSSPVLPLVRQAHQLVGKSFFDVVNILVPNQLEYAAFSIGTDQVFDLPLGKLSDLSEVTQDGNDDVGSSDGVRVDSRAQAIALLDQVRRFFRQAEPASPIPMLCERARLLAEQDFMTVLKDVLPKSALRKHDEGR
jgi:type VI secretion system protein ImpA